MGDNEETNGLEQGKEAEPNSNTMEGISTNSPTFTFLDLPFDVLADILILTGYPGDILAVARTSKQLCTQLVGPAAGFIWKKARIAVGLPDPAAYSAQAGTPQEVVGVGYFISREAAYAAFVFDGVICEVRLI